MKITIKGPIADDSEGRFLESFGIECFYPAMLKNAIDTDPDDDIDVYINSQGGSVAAGREIYSMLYSHKGNVNIHVTGMAASAASFIMCARHSDISPVAQVMVHCASCNTYGNHTQLKKTAEILENIDTTIAAAYCQKAGMEPAEALKLMEKETWLNAEECVKLGIIDEIAKPVENSENKTDTNADAKRAEARYKLLSLKGENKS